MEKLCELEVYYGKSKETTFWKMESASILQR